MKKHPKFKDRRGPPLKKMPGGVTHVFKNYKLGPYSTSKDLRRSISFGRVLFAPDGFVAPLRMRTWNRTAAL